VNIRATARQGAVLHRGRAVRPLDCRPLADGLLCAAIDSGDLLGRNAATGEHFLLLAIPAPLFAQLCQHGASREDMEPDDDGEDSDDEDSLQEEQRP